MVDHSTTDLTDLKVYDLEKRPGGICGQPVVLVTGASTGIGLEIVRRFMSSGFHVIITARSESLPRLMQLGFGHEGRNYWVRSLDVCESCDQMRLHDEIQRRLGRLDVLVNNAAFVHRNKLTDKNGQKLQEHTFRVNFWAPLELIRLFVPLMAKGSRSYIINICSASAFMPLPTMGIYSASKQALQTISEVLFHELRECGVRICVVAPGLVRTESARRQTGLTSGHPVDSLLSWAFYRCRATPEQVAHFVADLVNLKNPPLLSVVTTDAWILSLFRRLVPSELYVKFFNLALILCQKLAGRDSFPPMSTPAIT